MRDIGAGNLMNKLLVVLLLAGILVFGCIGQPPAPQGGAPSGGAAGGAGAGAAAGTGAGAGAGAGGANATGGTGQAAGGTTGGAAGGIAAASYAAAVASGIPLVCTATSSGQTNTFYVKGQQMLISGTSGGEPYTVIVKNSASYMKLSPAMKSTFAQMGKNCDWLVFTANETTTAAGAPSPPVSAESYQQPSVVWSCNPGQFGDDEFLTPGSTCTMQDLVPTPPAGTGGYNVPGGYGGY